MSGTSMIPEQRRHEILAHLRREPVKSYAQLAEALGVSHMTVRRDAQVLADQGRARLTQGGVAAAHSMGVEPPRPEKARARTPEKSAIAREAARLVEDSTAVYLDAGTTIAMLAPLLLERRDLTVVTNDLSTAAALLDHRGVELIMIGGRVDRANHSTHGRMATAGLAELTLDLAFISCSSWDVRRGLTTPTEAKVDPKRAAMHIAARSVLVADSSKHGSYATHRVAALDELDVLVTDDGLDPSALALLREAGPELVLAAVGS